MSSPHTPIEETPVFQLFEECAETVWRAVSTWGRFAHNTLGAQLVRAIDSVNANLAEGEGRGSEADRLRFFYIARGSAREARLWIRRAIDRELLPKEEGSGLLDRVDHGIRQLNLLIGYRRRQVTNRVREARETYGADELEEATSFGLQP